MKVQARRLDMDLRKEAGTFGQKRMVEGQQDSRHWGWRPGHRVWGSKQVTGGNLQDYQTTEIQAKPVTADGLRARATSAGWGADAVFCKESKLSAGPMRFLSDKCWALSSVGPSWTLNSCGLSFPEQWPSVRGVRDCHGEEASEKGLCQRLSPLLPH